MELSYKGIWGYAPLDCESWPTPRKCSIWSTVRATRSVTAGVWSGLIEPWSWWSRVAGQGHHPGDTDFTHTAQLDRWDAGGIKFILGMDAHPKVVGLAEALPEHRPGSGWSGCRSTRS